MCVYIVEHITYMYVWLNLLGDYIVLFFFAFSQILENACISTFCMNSKIISCPMCVEDVSSKKRTDGLMQCEANDGACTSLST